MPRVTITVPEKTPQPYRFDLSREVVAIGRNNDNDIVVGCGSVSGKHAEMKRVKSGYQLIDIGSTNGIKVDGARQMVVILESGMTVKLGDVEFGFTLSEEELEVLAAEVESTKGSSTSKKEEKKETTEKSASKGDHKEDEDEDEDDLDKLPELPPEKKSKEKPKEEKAEKKKKEPKRKEEKPSKPKKRRNIEVEDEDDEPRLSKSVSIGSGFILFALIVAAAAFLYGANARHKKDTGEGLLKAVVNKEDVTKDAPPEPEDGAE